MPPVRNKPTWRILQLRFSRKDDPDEPQPHTEPIQPPPVVRTEPVQPVPVGRKEPVQPAPLPPAKPGNQRTSTQTYTLPPAIQDNGLVANRIYTMPLPKSPRANPARATGNVPHPCNHSAPPLSTPNYFDRSEPPLPIDLIFALPCWPPSTEDAEVHLHRAAVPPLTLADVHAHMPASYQLLLFNLRSDLKTWFDELDDLAAKTSNYPLALGILGSVTMMMERLGWIEEVCKQIRERNEKIRQAIAAAIDGEDPSSPRARIYDTPSKLNEMALSTPIPEVYHDLEPVIAERLVLPGFLLNGVADLCEELHRTVRGAPEELLSETHVKERHFMMENVNALFNHIHDWAYPLKDRLLLVQMCDVTDEDVTDFRNNLEAKKALQAAA